MSLLKKWGQKVGSTHLDMKVCLMHNYPYEPTITHRVSWSMVSSYEQRPQGR